MPFTFAKASCRSMAASENSQMRVESVELSVTLRSLSKRRRTIATARLKVVQTVGKRLSWTESSNPSAQCASKQVAKVKTQQVSKR